MIYYAYKEDGSFDGFYDSNINTNIPVNSIQISEELWQELLKGNFKLKDMAFGANQSLALTDKNTYFEEVQPTMVTEDKTQLEILKETVDLLVMSLL